MVNVSVEQLLNYLKQRSDDNWLIGYDSYEFYDLTKTYYQQFITEKPVNILLVEENPFRFLAVFLAAVATNCPIFLCNPDWQQNEWEQVLELVHPGLIISIDKHRLTQILSLSRSSARECGQSLQNFIMIPTGGSSGKIRFAIHTWETLTASVRGFYQYFGIQAVNSFCILPLYHVSGLMQFFRSFLTGGKLRLLPYQFLKKQINSFPETNFNTKKYFISLVPTQLQFLLQSNLIWLSQFYTVLLGGAPAWPSLLEQARQFNIRLAPTYGMTETASQIVTLKPEDFLKGNNSSGQVLPHAKVTLSNLSHGVIAIQSDSLFLGYSAHDLNKNNIFYTDDIGNFDTQDYLYILGRNSQKIITGGENVYSSEVEAAILETQLVTDVAVIGLPDPHWGEIIAAVYVSKTQETSSKMIKTSLENKISKYKIPKHWIAVESLPRNKQGKLSYEKLKSILFY